MPSLVGTRRLEWLRTQRESAFSEIERITNRATDEDRDLDDAEQSSCEARRSQVEHLDAQIEVEVQAVNRQARFRELTADVGAPTRELEVVQRAAPTDAAITYDTPGAYLADYMYKSRDSERARRFETYLRANQITTDNPGIIPKPVLGPVITQTYRRPSIDATTKRPMPGGGKTFSRPVIVQNTLVGPQGAEKTELPSQPLKINPIDVSKTTYGGWVNLSFQDRDWSDPAILDLLIADLAGQYAKQTNLAFATYFTGAISATQPVTDPTQGDDWLTAIYTAAATILNAVGEMPDTIWVSPDVWSMLGSMVDLSGRPLFPTVAPGNAIGQMGADSLTGSFAGIRLVVDGALAAKSAFVGVSSYVETYESVGGQVTATEPSVLGMAVAYYGYMAWLVLQASAFVKLVLP